MPDLKGPVGSASSGVSPSPTPSPASSPNPSPIPSSTPIPSPTPSPTPSPPPGAVTILPLDYFRFEDSSNPGLASIGQGSLNFSYYGSPATPSSGGQVGGYVNFKGGLVQGPASIPASTGATNAIAVEFLMKPGAEFNQKRGDRVFAAGGVEVVFSAEFIRFTTPGDSFSVPLNGVGPRSLGYFLDGRWHHFVFQYNGASGAKEIWVDGTLPGGFSKTAPLTATLFAAPVPLALGSTTDYDMFRGGLDEFAVYQAMLPGSFIQQHELERIAGKAYTFLHNSSVLVPTPPTVTALIDGMEFAPGTTFPTSATAPAQGVSVSALDQLRKFPSPRLRTGTALPRNPSYFDWSYLGNLQYNVASLANQIGGQIYTEMADRWNYYLTQRTDFSTVANFSNVNRPEYHLRQATLARPDLPFWAITLRVQNTSAQTRQDLPDACYLRDQSGVPVLFSSKKRIRPFSSSATALSAGCPDSNYDQDANFVISGFNATLSSSGIHQQTVFSGFSDNNEFLYPKSETVLSADPAVRADYSVSGFSKYVLYDSNHFGRLDSRFRDLIRSSNPRLQNATYQSYQVDTDQGYYWEWSSFRQSFTPYLGHPLATPDFYPRYPSYWRDGASAWHGFSWMERARRYEIDKGDPLYSPYTAAGWDADEGLNIRPAQWLGLQKLIHALGAPYTLPGYYIEKAPWPKAEAYIHQVAMPVYAQAAFSRVEDLLLNGQLVDGDVSLVPTDPASSRKGYGFWAGDPRMKILIRKSNSSEVYLITGTIQPNSSMIGNAEISKTAQITLNGESLRFEVRRQGSMYVYDRRNPANRIFYQVDAWHESTHPWFWSQNASVEAELPDTGLSATAPELKTEQAPGAQAGDFSGARTYVSFPSGQTAFGAGLQYSYRPVDSVSRTVHVLARARSGTAGGTLAFSVDGGVPMVSPQISSAGWIWTPVFLPSLNAPANHLMKVVPSNANVEIDRFQISDQAP